MKNRQGSPRVGKFLLRFILAFICSPAGVTYAQGQKTTLCSLESTPSEVRSYLKAHYAGWRVKQVDDLKAFALEDWRSQKPLQCPGMAIGTFKPGKGLAYAFLLVPVSRPDSSYK